MQKAAKAECAALNTVLANGRGTAHSHPATNNGDVPADTCLRRLRNCDLVVWSYAVTHYEHTMHHCRRLSISGG